MSPRASSEGADENESGELARAKGPGYPTRKTQHALQVWAEEFEHYALKQNLGSAISRQALTTELD